MESHEYQECSNNIIWQTIFLHENKHTKLNFTKLYYISVKNNFSNSLFQRSAEILENFLLYFYIICELYFKSSLDKPCKVYFLLRFGAN